MAKPIGGSEGPGVPRPSGQLPEEPAPLGFGQKLDRLQSGFRASGRLTAEVRQGDAHDVPTDRTSSRQRKEALAGFKAAFLKQTGESWDSFIAGFADRPDPNRGQDLQDALAKYSRAPGQFLRGDSAFLSALTRGLREGGTDALLQDLSRALADVPVPDRFDADPDTARLSGASADHVAALTEVMVKTILGGADRLPQDFVDRLRDAGAEILRADLTPQEKSDALCQLCKGAVCQHGLGPDLMLRGDHPGQAAAAKCFLILISTGETRNLSPDLAKALGPLVQDLPARLQDFMRALGMPRVDG